MAATFFAQFEPDDWRMNICDERSFGDPERRPKVIEQPLLSSPSDDAMDGSVSNHWVLDPLHGRGFHCYHIFGAEDASYG